MFTRLSAGIAVAALAIAGLTACGGSKPAPAPADGASQSQDADSGKGKAPKKSKGGHEVASLADLKNDGDYYTDDNGVTYRKEGTTVKIEGDRPSLDDVEEKEKKFDELYGDSDVSGASGSSSASGIQDEPTTPGDSGSAALGSGSDAGGSTGNVGDLCKAFPEISMVSARAFLPYVVGKTADIDEQLDALNKLGSVGDLDTDMKTWKDFLAQAKTVDGDAGDMMAAKMVTPEVRSASDRLKAAYRACRE